METPLLLRRQKWRSSHIVGLSSFVLVLSFALVLLITGKSTKVRAEDANVAYIQAPNIDSASGDEAVRIPFSAPAADTAQAAARTSVNANDIPTNYAHNVPVVEEGICKNAEVVLSDKQRGFVKAFGDYLASKGVYAIVTSGTRTGQDQIDIIRQRIEEHGMLRRFPAIEHATVAATSTWLRAWQWLRARRVPVNAPADVAGTDGKVSMHLKGLAIDFIASSLDRLHGWLAAFERSSYAKQTDMRIAAIVREPGCVHINLAG